MCNTMFLVVLEIENKGFLLALEESMVDADNSLRNAYKYTSCDLNIFDNDFEFFDSYEINGNEKYINTVESSVSNGVTSVHILKIDNFGELSLQYFKRERDNTSTVFGYEKYEQELDRITDLFYQSSFFAN